MNKNQMIGIALLLLLLNIFFVRINKDNNENVKKDNIEINKTENKNESDNKNENDIVEKVSTNRDTADNLRADKAKALNLNNDYDDVNNENFILENDYIKYTFSNIGASIIDVELKKFKNHKGQNVKLVENNSLIMAFDFRRFNINTNKLSFNETISNDKSITFKFTDIDDHNIIITYELDENNPYVIKQNVKSSDNNFVDYKFNALLIQNEKYLEDCKNKASLNYYQENKDFKTINNVDLKTNKTKQDIKHCEWISYKQKFFTIGMTCDTPMNGETYIKYNKDYVNEYDSSVTFTDNVDDIQLKYYFGPNELKYFYTFHNTFDKNIYLGMFGVRTFNKYIILPISKSLGSKCGGVLFLVLLAILIQLLTLPLNYRQFEVTEKMKIFNKLIIALGNKYKNNQQQLAMEQISAYRDLGINPLSAILYSFIQFPFIIAIYNYIPLDFLYRNTSFLWCSDLASFDSIYNFGFYIPLYGDHISLSAILMAITTFIYTLLNLENEKSINPIFIVFLLLILCISNKFCCALNIYYIIYNIITFINKYLFSKKLNIKSFEDKVNNKIKKLTF